MTDAAHAETAAGLLSDYLTQSEVARQLNVTEKTLRSWRAMGEGPAVTRIGRRKIRFKRDTVRRWLEEREAE